MRSDNSVRVPIDVQFGENRIRNRGWYRNCGNVRPLGETQANSVAGAADPLLVVVSGLAVQSVECGNHDLEAQAARQRERLRVVQIDLMMRRRNAPAG